MSTKTVLPVSFNYDLADGPSRDTLLDAFKYAYSEEVEIPIKFTIVLGHDPEGRIIIPARTKKWRITKLQHEDGSGQSFNIEGYCKANLRITRSERITVYLTYRFKAYFNCRTRKGRIELTEC